MVNHSKEHLQKKMEQFVNSAGRVIQRIDFHPVASHAGGVIHTAYIIYEEVDPEEGLGELQVSPGGTQI
jgi:hypothetical protein